MTKILKHVFNGAGSLYDLSPTINNPYQKANGKLKTTEESLREIWEQVGGYLQQSMNDFDDEQKSGR